MDVSHKKALMGPVCFRLSRRSYCYLPLASIPQFVACYLFFFYFAPRPAIQLIVSGSPEQMLALAIVMAVPVLMELLIVYLLLAYLRTRLRFDEASVTCQGILISKRLSVGEVVEVEWPSQVHRQPVVILKTAVDRIKIPYNEFGQSSPEEIIDLVRGMFPSEIQIGWQWFAKAIEEAKTPRPARRSWGLGVFCALLYLGLAIGWGIAGFALGGGVLLAASAGCLAGALWYGWRVWRFRGT